jgi:hypothetical protein
MDVLSGNGDHGEAITHRGGVRFLDRRRVIIEQPLDGLFVPLADQLSHDHYGKVEAGSGSNIVNGFLGTADDFRIRIGKRFPQRSKGNRSQIRELAAGFLSHAITAVAELPDQFANLRSARVGEYLPLEVGKEPIRIVASELFLEPLGV